jgi:hypothetical protein
MELAWPQYEVAPPDTVFALGVVSINYARFERTNVWMIAAVANMREAHAAVMSARTNATDRVKLIEAYLLQSKWPADVETAIRHYMRAMGTLITNRNVLIHSNIVRGTQDRSAIYSVNRQGNTSLFQATVAEIRQVADDLNTYFYFGLSLANYIASEIHHMAREAGMMAISQLPQLPPLPVHINSELRK